MATQKLPQMAIGARVHYPRNPLIGTVVDADLSRRRHPFYRVQWDNGALDWAHGGDIVAATEQQASAEWAVRWPNHCRHCGGEGQTFYPGNRETPDEADLCGCVANGLCPRCGKASTLEDGAPCAQCGWNWGENPGDARPKVMPAADERF